MDVKFEHTVTIKLSEVERRLLRHILTISKDSLVVSFDVKRFAQELLTLTQSEGS